MKATESPGRESGVPLLGEQPTHLEGIFTFRLHLRLRKAGPGPCGLSPVPPGSACLR